MNTAWVCIYLCCNSVEEKSCVQLSGTPKQQYIIRVTVTLVIECTGLDEQQQSGVCLHAAFDLYQG